MNLKKIALISAIALVVLGCVLAAGCTSTTTTQQTASDDKILGAWTHTTDEDVVVVVMMDGGNGYYLGLAKEDAPRLLKYAPLNWTRNADGTITHDIADRVEPIIMTYDAEKDIFNDDHGYTLTRMNPATGIWFYEKKNDNGVSVKKTYTVYPDGTVLLLSMNENGALKVIEGTLSENTDGTVVLKMANGTERTWTKESDESYVLENKNGEKVRWTMDSGKMIFSSDNGAVYSKKFTDSYYYLSILGPWYNEKNKRLIFFNADGTFSMYLDREKVMEGTWSIPEFGKFAIHIEKGTNPEGKDVSGSDTVWTYDRVNNTFTAPNGDACIRPSADVDNLTYVKFN